MRRTILAILAGVATTGAAAVVCTLFNVYYHLQEVWAWLVPQFWEEPAFVTVFHLTDGLLIGGPGIIVAALIARRRPYPRGCCRRCGYDLTGNVSGRCPECGGAVKGAGSDGGHGHDGCLA